MTIKRVNIFTITCNNVGQAIHEAATQWPIIIDPEKRKGENK
jgi:hypothetical protein